MVNTVQPTNPYANRPTTLGERLIREARQSLPGASDTGQGRVVEDEIDLSTKKLRNGKRAVNFSQVEQAQAEVRGAKREKIVDALDRGFAQGAKAGDLFRRVFRGLFSLFRSFR
ncbi:MAG: hypothetical protein VW268_01730 [Rhodospirillaceae bacterium]